MTWVNHANHTCVKEKAGYFEYKLSIYQSESNIFVDIC